jgi:hypothetical protein
LLFWEVIDFSGQNQSHGPTYYAEKFVTKCQYMLHNITEAPRHGVKIARKFHEEGERKDKLKRGRMKKTWGRNLKHVACTLSLRQDLTFCGP